MCRRKPNAGDVKLKGPQLHQNTSIFNKREDIVVDLLWHLQTRVIEEAEAASLFLGTAVASSLRLAMGLVYLNSDKRQK